MHDRPADATSRQMHYSMMVNTWVRYVQPGLVAARLMASYSQLYAVLDIIQKQSGGSAWAAQPQA